MFSSWECALPNSYCGFFVSVISIETNKKHYFYIHNYTATYTTYTTNVIYLGLVKEGVISLGHLWWVACWVYFSSTPCSFTIMNFVIVQASTQMKLVPRKYTSGILTVSMCMYSLIKSCILKRSATPHKHTRHCWHWSFLWEQWPKPWKQCSPPATGLSRDLVAVSRSLAICSELMEMFLHADQ